MSHESKPTKSKSGAVTKPKLRASCDACSLSKVKCDRQQPTCQRCQNLRVNCTYSPSRRMGKPAGSGSQKRAQQQAAQQAAQQVGMNRLGVLTPEREPCPSVPQSSAQSPTPERAYSNDYTADVFGLYLPEFDSLSQMQWGEPQFAITPPNSTAYFHDDLLSSTADMFLENFQSPASTVSDSYEESIPQYFTPTPTPPSWRPSPPPTVEESYKPFTPSNSPTDPVCKGIHDCHSLASQTLASLNLPNAHCHSAASQISISPALPTIDQVLTNNRAAVNTVTNLLSCNCSFDPNFGILLSLICSKILSSYEAISKGKFSTPNSDSSSTGYSVPGSPQPEHFFMEIAIRIGDYQLEPDAQLTVQLILGEVQRVGKLVEKFSERFCKSTSSSPAGSDVAEAGICMSLESFLKLRVKSTTEGLIKVRSSLDSTMQY
ncbi:hypothetical protein BJ508DRAFT_357029 [Ascobolus immersus RN42]|uniref:Zn(2)-C6 fungal-type domain-containing protein n=1 Tax=Ascobolus immersus RN42 TaxID=1160509 RepID=A0A3N4IVH4_ASCIM|nr:hypothetical protein BJ508DRAFT_357029 [Ascobolus immersus RN42]